MKKSETSKYAAEGDAMGKANDRDKDPKGDKAEGAMKGSEADGSTQPIKEKEEVPRSGENIIHNGSAGAFEGTENMRDAYDSDEDNDDLAMGRIRY